METLHKKLKESGKVVISAVFAAVTGMGGIGKTELALQYALKHKNKAYQGGVCWLQARDVDLVTQIINYGRIQLNLEIPDDLTAEQQVAYCWRNWDYPGDVLVVFDDVTSYETIEPYLPPNETRFKIIITSRVQHLAQAFQDLNLEVLSEDAALELLRSLIGESRVNDEEEEAKKLCHQLGYLPLGLELVGQYLARKQDLSIIQMQQRLESKGLEQKALKQPTTKTTAERGVKAAFELSWEELSKDAQELACFLSLFAVAPIKWGLVEQCLSNEDKEDLEDLRDDILVNSLLKRTDKGVYLLHTLIRQYFQEKLESISEAEAFKRQFCKGMVVESKKIPYTPTKSDIEEVNLSIPHLAESTRESLLSYFEKEDIIWAFTGLGRFYEGQGIYDSAESWNIKCLEVCKALFDGDNPDVASSLNNLASLYHNQGKYHEAETLYIQALEMRQRLFDGDNPDVANSLNNLASLYFNQGKYHEAETLYIQALEMYQRLFDGDNYYVAGSLNNLGLLYKNQGKYHEAETLYIQALEMYQRLFDGDNRDVASSLNNLASLYDNQGKYHEAETLLIQALEMTQLLFDGDNRDVASSLNNLGLLYKNQGKYHEAETLLIQALEMAERVLGNVHPHTEIYRKNLAILREKL